MLERQEVQRGIYPCTFEESDAICKNMDGLRDYHTK